MPEARQPNQETEHLRPGSTLVRLAVDDRWGAHVRMTHDNTEFVMRGDSQTPNRLFSPDNKAAKKAHGRITVGPGIHVYSSIEEGVMRMGTSLGYLGLYVEDIPENAPHQPRTSGLDKKRQKLREHSPQVIYAVDAEREEITMTIDDKRGSEDFILLSTHEPNVQESRHKQLRERGIQSLLSTPINRESTFQTGGIQIAAVPALGIYVPRAAYDLLTSRTSR